MHKKQTQKNLFESVHALCAALCIISLTVTPLPLIAADDAEDLGDKLSDIQDKKEEKQQLKAVEENKAVLLNRQIQQLTTEAQQLEGKIDDAERDLKETENDITRIRKSIVEQQDALESQRGMLSQLVRKQYQSSGESMINQFIVPTAFAFVQEDYVSQTQNDVHATIDRIEKLKVKLESDRTKLEEKKTEAEEEKKKLEQRNEYLESTRSYKAYVAAQTAKNINNYTKEISELEQEEIEIRREIEKIEAAKLDDVDLGGLPSKKEADFDYPVENVRITQYYGKTSFSATAYKSGVHNGVDFAGGGDILAAADGKVVATGNMGRYGYGRWIAIDHKNGLVTLYGHLSKVQVSKGDKVDKGDDIGNMGTTGYSTGVHLHFTVFAEETFEVVNSSSVSGLKVPTGASVNPMIYL